MAVQGITPERALLLERMLAPDLYLSPLKFAMWAYPWGEGDLREFDGPRKWQRDVMLDIERYLEDGIGMREISGKLPEFYRHAVASGRGPGKSALFGMLAHWFASTRIGGSVWVAANGEPQLRTKTFPEISKWIMRGINREFFETNAMSIKPATWFRNYIESPDGLSRSAEYYYVSGQLWSEETPDAFAGAHNFDGEFAIFDEASGIPDAIWSVQNGVFTENIIDRLWMAFSNPRKSEGAFFECFHRNKDIWRHTHVDARTVEGISASTYADIIRQYGPESYEAHVEVYGTFPPTGLRQFIDTPLARDAMEREVEADPGAPLLMGVDVARFGEDRSVIAFRQGRDARSIPMMVYRKLSAVELADKVAWLADKYKPDAIFVDGGGVGGGVVDILKSMRYRIIEVQAGSSAEEKLKYKNKRVEMWARFKEWLDTGCLPNDPDLLLDMCSLQYDWHPVTNQLILESKEDMRSRGYQSPDMAEALIQTFAKAVARLDMPRQKRSAMATDIDYDLFA